MTYLIPDEVIHILAHPKDDGSLLDNLTDKFRTGKDPSILYQLLISNKDEFVEIGLHILNEITIKDPELIDKLKRQLNQLINDEKWIIRAQSFFILSQMYEDDNQYKEAAKLHLLMSNDKDVGIREAGEKLLKDGHM